MFELRLGGIARLLACAACGACSSQGQGAGEPDPDPPSASAGTETSAPDETGDGSTGEEEPPPSAECEEVGRPPLRRLTLAQFDNAVRDLLGVEGSPSAGIAADERVGAFHSNTIAPVSDLLVEQYAEVAEAVAASADIDALVPCERDTADCPDAFIEAVGLRAYRRPLSERQVELYRGLFDEGTEGAAFDDGARLVLTAMLQSPYFLYQVEHTDVSGDGPVALDGYELASRLSFFLWNSIPDDALLVAAEDGALTADVRAQAERLLDDARAKDAIGSFHHQWLGIDRLPEVEKDDDVHPEFDADLVALMLDDTATFADHVIRTDDGRLETLLTATYAFPRGALRDVYGVPGQGAGLVELDPTQRAGLLTQPAWLAAHAHTAQSSPVLRGVVVREHVLCDPLAPPPDNVNDTAPDPDPNATTRERFAEHTEGPACAPCHALIDGIGFGLEHYDAVGAFRAEENGAPVDASGTLVGTDVDGDFDGAIELSAALADSEQVRACVAHQWFAFAARQPASDADSCAMTAISERFADTDHNVRELILAVATSDSFRFTPAQD